ncbi:hypothetical protein ACHHYP_09130 [Achlya hypogyna]|uniref:Uncharacterized protein n=1 Tax=Achlya hypogyna TaxID=1202772 RepID=A0A1V9YNP1_ACHHY|nr:hypothetical protein ACHHYP_09130 [Achlya hypogyna]
MSVGVETNTNDDLLKRACAALAVPAAYVARNDPHLAELSPLLRYGAALYIGALSAVAAHATIATCVRRCQQDAALVRPWKSGARSIHYERGLEHFLERDYVKAIQHLTRAVQHHPQEALYYSRRADCYMLSADTTRAYQDYAMAAVLSPGDEDAKARAKGCAAKLSSVPPLQPIPVRPPSVFQRMLRPESNKPWTATLRDVVLMIVLTIPVFLLLHTVLCVIFDTAISFTSIIYFCAQHTCHRVWHFAVRPVVLAVAPVAKVIATKAQQCVASACEAVFQGARAAFQFLHQLALALKAPVGLILQAISRVVGAVVECASQPLRVLRWLFTSISSTIVEVFVRLARAIDSAFSPEFKRRCATLAKDLAISAFEVGLGLCRGVWAIAVWIARGARWLVTATYDLSIALGIPSAVAAISSVVTHLLHGIFCLVSAVTSLAADLVAGALSTIASIVLLVKSIVS